MPGNSEFVLTCLLAIVVLGFFGVILWKVISGGINIDQLISEADGKASLSRFQLLLFTFVVAGLFLILSLRAGRFVDIPDGVQILLGISSASYLVSKAVGRNQTREDPPSRDT